MAKEVIIIDFQAQGQDKIIKGQNKINALTKRILENNLKITKIRERAGDELRPLTQTENRQLRILKTRVGLQRNELGFTRLKVRSQKEIAAQTTKVLKSNKYITDQKRKQLELAKKQARAAEKQATAAANRATQERGRKLDSLMMGAGFPLLFGGGAGSIGGGVLGAALGGAGGGFGAQILFSAIGGQIDQLVQKMNETGEALQSTAGTVQLLGDNALWADEQTELLVDELLSLGKVEEANKLAAQELARVMGKDTWDAFNELGSVSKQLAQDTQIVWFEFQRLASYLIGPLMNAIGTLMGATSQQIQRKNLESALAAEGVDTSEMKKSFRRLHERKDTLFGLGDDKWYELDMEGYINAMRKRLAESGGAGGITVPITPKDRTQFQPPDSSKGATAKVDEEARQRARLLYEQQLLAIEQQRIPLDTQAAELYKVKVALEKEDLRLKKEIAEITAGTGAFKELEIERAKTKSARTRAKLENDEVQRQYDIQKSFDDTIFILEKRIEMAEAQSEAEKEIYKWQLKQKALEGKGFSEEQVDAIIEKMKKLEEATKKGALETYMKGLNDYLKDTEGRIVELAQVVENELASAMSSAVTSVITGTGSVEEAFSNMFANIGKAFIDMATKMIAKALILKALGALGGGTSGGIGSFASDAGLGSTSNVAFSGSSEFPMFAAEGGYVTRPTEALVGEGADAEYIIPSKKMAEAMERYSSGIRGDAVIPASGEGYAQGGDSSGGDLSTAINISGGVLNFNDESYIKQDQLPSIITQASKGGEARTLAKLRSSPATRRRIGMA